MKKILAMTLALAMSLSLAACGAGRTVFPACNEEKVVLHCVNVQKTAVEVSAVIQDNLLIYLLTNAGLLLVAATVLTELRPLRAILKQQERSIPGR